MKETPPTRPGKGGKPASEPAPKAPKHLAEHEPTVIHDPTADETLLYRWLRESLDKGPRFWLPLGLAAVALVVVWIAVTSLRSGDSAGSEGWQELMLAQGADDRVKIGESSSGDSAAWALLQAAETRYQEAFNDLPNNREAALPLLSNAHDLFKKARDKAPTDSAVKRFAAMGMAAALEARGDLEGAIEQYQAVAKAFPGTDQAERAEERAALLKKPETVAFYQKFSAYKPPEMTLPPRGRGSLDFPGLPGLPANHPALNGPTIPASGLPLGTIPPASTSTRGDTPPTAPTPAGDTAPPDPTPPADTTPAAEAPAPSSSPEAAPQP